MQAILHCDRNWGIGKKNDLMFRLPLDMAFFRTTTLNKVVVMGSNTLLSFPGGKPLKKRTNIVLWPGGERERALSDGFIMIESFDELLKEIKKYDSDSVFVIGGAMMYKSLLPYCGRVLLTKVDADGGAEVFFENLDENPDWVEEERGDEVIDNGYPIRFCTYRNLKVKDI